MNEIEAYMKLYGWLVLTVPHYVSRCKIFEPIIPNHPTPTLISTKE